MESILAESVAAPLHTLHTLSEDTFAATIEHARSILFAEENDGNNYNDNNNITDNGYNNTDSSLVSAVVYLAVESKRLGWQPTDVHHALEALATLPSQRRRSLVSLCCPSSSSASSSSSSSSFTAADHRHITSSNVPASLHGLRYRVLYRTDTDTDRHPQQPLILLSLLCHPPTPPIHCTATPEALSDMLVQLRDAVKQVDRSASSS